MLSNAPTDNLYKFVTFLGVALIIFCSWSYTEAVKRLDATTIEQYAREAKAAERQAVINYKLTQMREIAADKTKDDAAKKPRNEILMNDILALATQGKEAAFAEMQPELTLLHTKDDVRMYKYGIGLGLAMTVIGALAWYFLHQRHQDSLLREQVREASTTKKPRQAGSLGVRPVQLPKCRRVFSFRPAQRSRSGPR